MLGGDEHLVISRYHQRTKALIPKLGNADLVPNYPNISQLTRPKSGLHWLHGSNGYQWYQAIGVDNDEPRCSSAGSRMSSTAMAKIWNADLAHAAEVRVSGHQKTGQRWPRNGRDFGGIVGISWWFLEFLVGNILGIQQISFGTHEGGHLCDTW